MNDAQIARMKDDVYNFVFQFLDCEPELTGLDAGCIAARTADRFEQVLKIQMDLEEMPHV